MGLNNYNGDTPPTQCRVCSVIDSKRTTTHLLSSSEWDFYHCLNCQNWFQIPEGSRETPRLVLDENLINALNAYYANSVQEVEGIKEGLDVIHKVLGKIGALLDRFISRYSVQE